MSSRKSTSSARTRLERPRNDENVDTSQQRYQLRRDGPVELPIEHNKWERSKERKGVSNDEKQRRVERLQEAQRLRKLKQAEVSELRREARIKRTTYKGTMTQKRTSAHLDQIINSVAAHVSQPVEEIVREHFDDDFNASPAKQQRKLRRKERVFRERLELAISMSERKPEVAEMESKPADQGEPKPAAQGEPKPAAQGESSRKKRPHPEEEASSSKDARPRLDNTQQPPDQASSNADGHQQTVNADEPPIPQPRDDDVPADVPMSRDGERSDSDPHGYDADSERTCSSCPGRCSCASGYNEYFARAPPEPRDFEDDFASVELPISVVPSNTNSPLPTVGRQEELTMTVEALNRRIDEQEVRINSLERQLAAVTGLCQRQGKDIQERQWKDAFRRDDD
uniref:BZIP domain-containing protein n=1 Tax=Panagrellus redivivus TaxID=6233 RepID=A0A7E4UQB3_PANRE